MVFLYLSDIEEDTVWSRDCTHCISRRVPLPPEAAKNDPPESKMKLRPSSLQSSRPFWAVVAGSSILTVALLILSHCSGIGSVVSNPSNQMGTIAVSLSDPPSCGAPTGSFKSVFITVRSVQAHISATADDNTPGWQELAPQLNSQPVQLDLLHLPQNGACLLSQLGSATLPVGDYQQLRLLLVPNAAPTGSVPATNACASLGQVFNCVVDSNNNFSELLLSSQANTGLKIPPGQVVGGPIHVAAGQTVDINVDFNACASIVAQGNGAFRLKPVLTAGQVSTNTTGLSGQVIDSVTLQPVPGAMVALEQADHAGIDRIFMQAAADANGRFSFCPLPMGAVFDVVADAVNAAGVAYNATVVLNVPGGSSLTTIPLIAETGTATGPGTIQGFVTALNGASGANIDAAVSAFQMITLSGGGTRQVTIPLLNTSTQTSMGNIAVLDATTCPAGSPAGAFCAQYTLIVPASNPNVGSFSAGAVTFTTPASGPVLYSVEARATVPMSGGTSICSPASQTTNLDSTAMPMPLQVTAGMTVNAKELDFSACM